MDNVRPEKLRPTGESETPKPVSMPAKMPEVFSARQMEDAPVKFEGNVPPQLKRILSQQQQPRQAVDDAPAAPAPRPDLGGDESFTKVMDVLAGLTGRYEKIKLPSRGKFYANGTGPADGVLHVRPMTGRDEQILATQRHVRSGQALNMIFRECIREKYDPENLLSEDRTYLLIFLRGISYTPEYEVEVRCPECNSQAFAHTIDLNAFSHDPCPDDFGPETLTGVLPTSGLKFSYRLSTGGDDTRVQKHREVKLREFGGQAVDDSLLYRTALLLTSIEDVRSQVALQELVARLPINDVNYLRNLVNNPPFKVNTESPVLCPHCGNPFTLDMPLEVGFFFPRQKKKTPSLVSEE